MGALILMRHFRPGWHLSGSAVCYNLRDGVRPKSFIQQPATPQVTTYSPKVITPIVQAGDMGNYQNFRNHQGGGARTLYGRHRCWEADGKIFRSV